MIYDSYSSYGNINFSDLLKSLPEDRMIYLPAQVCYLYIVSNSTHIESCRIETCNNLTETEHGKFEWAYMYVNGDNYVFNIPYICKHPVCYITNTESLYACIISSIDITTVSKPYITKFIGIY